VGAIIEDERILITQISKYRLPKHNPNFVERREKKRKQKQTLFIIYQNIILFSVSDAISSRIRLAMLNYKYIPEENEKNLKEHKYSGKDMSILYNYAFSPFAEWCLK